MSAMEDFDEDYNLRYGGIARLLAPSGLEKLRQAHILVVGIGGVGSWTAEALARAGVGKLTLVDLDDVCVTNTNRQLHALGSTIGRPKVEVMAARLSDATPECEVRPIVEFFDATTMEMILDCRYDVIIDCIDSLHNKCLLIDSARKRGFSLISVGGAGGKFDPTLIKTSDLGFSTNDTLLKRVRKSLKREWGWQKVESENWGVQAVYSTERSVYLDSDGELKFVPDLKQNRRIDCNSGIGTGAWVTGSFGFIAAACAIKTIVENRAD